jgi:hypothetical protein
MKEAHRVATIDSAPDTSVTETPGNLKESSGTDHRPSFHSLTLEMVTYNDGEILTCLA